MVALARDLDFAASRFLTGLTAVFIARLRHALAWKVCTLSLLSSRHRGSPFQKRSLSDCGGINGIATAPAAKARLATPPRP